VTADEHISRTGMMAPPPDSDPAERPQPCVADGPELLDSRSDGLGAVNWCTGVGPDTGWL
jgi:hypothetical protein